MMFNFGSKSRACLDTLDDRLKLILNRAIRIIDFSIVYGHRSHEDQQKLFDQGLSKCLPGESKHNYNPSMAVDVAPYPIDWKDRDRFIYLAGILKGIASEMGVILRWGGDWDGDNDLKDQTFMDLAHIEIVT